MGESRENYYHNPALTPTRHWDDAPEIEDELRLMLGGTPEGAVQTIESLLDKEAHSMLGRDENTIEFINETARTFGFLPLIDVNDDGTFSVAAHAQAPLRRALAHFKRSKK